MGQINPLNPRVQQPVTQKPQDKKSLQELVTSLRELETHLSDLLDAAREIEDDMDEVYDTYPGFKSMNAVNSMTKLQQSIAYAWRGSKLTIKLMEDSSPGREFDY